MLAGCTRSADEEDADTTVGEKEKVWTWSVERRAYACATQARARTHRTAASNAHTTGSSTLSITQTCACASTRPRRHKRNRRRLLDLRITSRVCATGTRTQTARTTGGIVRAQLCERSPGPDTAHARGPGSRVREVTLPHENGPDRTGWEKCAVPGTYAYRG